MKTPSRVPKVCVIRLSPFPPENPNKKDESSWVPHLCINIMYFKRVVKLSGPSYEGIRSRLTRGRVVIVIMGDFHAFVFVPRFDTKLSEHGWAPSSVYSVFECSDEGVCWDARLTQMLARLTLVLTTTQS